MPAPDTGALRPAGAAIQRPLAVMPDPGGGELCGGAEA